MEWDAIYSFNGDVFICKEYNDNWIDSVGQNAKLFQTEDDIQLLVLHEALLDGRSVCSEVSNRTCRLSLIETGAEGDVGVELIAL
jgi:hypothetical protein